MQANQRRKAAKLSGFAGIIAFFAQLFGAGPTLDFEPVGDVFQTEQIREVSHSSESAQSNAMILVPRSDEQMRSRLKNRYIERSRFNGRGAIFDVYS